MLRILLVLLSLTYLTACTARPQRPQMKASPQSDDGNPVGPEEQKPGGEFMTPDGKVITLDLLVSRSSVRMLSFETLVSKLKAVSKLGEDHNAIKLARTLNQSLGGYNYAAGVMPENKWSNEKMSAWLQVVDQACREKSLQTRIAASGGYAKFIEDAMGRDVDGEEESIISDLQSSNLSADRKARVLCSGVLLSGEFISL